MGLCQGDSAAFGGDQFKLPEQERQLQTFFSVFYFAINSGALLSTFVTPILRQDVKCFGDDTCYSLAFGIPAFLMLLATVVLVMGKSMYVMKPPQGNVLTKVVGTVWTGLKGKFSGEANHEHWLDHAREKYGRYMVEDVKLLLRVLAMYLPLPVFWALFDQLGSRWTFQATRMNGAVGSYIIKPDQMQLANALFILVLIPVFDGIVYPLFNKIGLLKRPLQKMTIGGLLTASAFMISGFLELELEKTYDHVPKASEAHLHLMNALNCPISARISDASGDFNFHAELTPFDNHVFYELIGGHEFNVEVRVDHACEDVDNYSERYEVDAKDAHVSGVVIRATAEKQLQLVEVTGQEDPKKTNGETSKIRVLFDVGASDNQTLELRTGDEIFPIPSSVFNGDLQESNYVKIPPNSYDVYHDDVKIGFVSVGQGGVRNLYVSKERSLTGDFVLTVENSVHMLWLVPQYFVITAGEIMFSVTGLEFSYSQAPASMKSVLQASFLLTVAFGNLIVIIIAKAKAFDDQASEFFMFAVMMYVTMVIFAVMAYFYKYVDVEKRERERKEEQEAERQYQLKATMNNNHEHTAIENESEAVGNY